ncbi:MAG: SGNH/GDSL hydrolase family protein [Planctomycetota bacterium]|nr:SGNH/GDSL hydrolase family protein [Planctomycetota bacterium]
MRWILQALLFSIVFCCLVFSQEGSAQEAPADSPLPRVLIIGDSISIGYTPFVKQALKGRAEVIHNPGNAQHTGTGILKIDAWLGDGKWEVIHFNWGLWDLCYRDPPGSLKQGKKNGKVTFTAEQYGKNLEKLIQRLEKTGAKLIWASITHVPAGEAGRKVGDDIRYNAVAKKLMKKHRIPINDLHAASSRFAPELFRAPGNVHFKTEGRKKLAQLVTRKIAQALSKKPASDP